MNSLNLQPSPSNGQTINTGIRLLLVEDNPGDAMLVSELLADWVDTGRCWIMHCSTLADALLAIERNQFELILVDLALPDCNGLNTVMRIKATTETPLLILTGNDNEQLAVQSLSVGAQDFLEKEHLNRRVLHRAILYAVERTRSQTLYQRLLSQNPDGIIVLNQAGDILFANPAAARLWALEEAKLVGSRFEFAFSNNNRLEIQMGDRQVEMHAVETEWKGLPAWVVSLRDISEHKKLEQHLSYLAHHDPLTGLANRELLNDRLATSIRSAKRNENSLAILLLDLDRFKLVNDTLGHDAGDKLLKEVSQRLRNTVRDSDTVARTGGDEFVIVAINTDDIGASNLAAKILQQLTPPFVIEGHYFKVSSSIGIALYPRDGANAEELFKHADAAMYYAKQGGRNNYRFHDAITHRNTMRRLELENNLELALEHTEFALYFQPQLTLDGVIGAEALLRWKHPHMGLLSPAEFIPLLEQSHLIAKVELWVLLNACKQLQAWECTLHKNLNIAVNLSVWTLMHPQLVQLIEDVLSRTGMDKRRLELEITESILLKDTEQASKTMNALHELGVSVALDDFGTGYSSLAYLLQFPSLSTLKLDHTFVAHLAQNPRHCAIIGTLTDLAHSLDMRVVAEGVETPVQMGLLQGMKCDVFQGFLFSPPVPAEMWNEKFAFWNQGAQHWTREKGVVYCE